MGASMAARDFPRFDRLPPFRLPPFRLPPFRRQNTRRPRVVYRRDTGLRAVPPHPFEACAVCE
jgi:hypothetical protein